MAAAYSMDLRTRVMADADAGLSSKELAERYHVSRGRDPRGLTGLRQGFGGPPKLQRRRKPALYAAVGIAGVHRAFADPPSNC